jgi:Fe-S-cluster containining protein
MQGRYSGVNSDDGRPGQDAVQDLKRLHVEIDERTRRLEQRHADRLRCERGCHRCCIDGITVFEVEAELIRLNHDGLLRSAAAHAAGACAFLDESGCCRIYAERPYVCRTQGLPLRWFDENEAGETVECRDICPLNEAPNEPLEKLDDVDFWTIGPFEQRLAELQRAFGGGPLKRFSLRMLFLNPAGGRRLTS